MQQPSKELIWAASDLPVKAVEVPEWDMTVYVRTLMASEAGAAAALAPDGEPLPNFYGRFAALVMCDAEGKPMFGPDDAEALGRKSRCVMEHITEEAQKHNGMIKDKAAAKNSEPTTD